jgi:hypothetical protein
MKRSFGRARRQLVAPQSGDHQHVGFADPGIELVVEVTPKFLIGRFRSAKRCCS